MKLAKLLIFILSLLSLASCDPDHLKKCEWYIVPDAGAPGKAEPGFIKVCARNYTVNKQDCRLQTTIDFAEKVYTKKFRYVDLTKKTSTMPWTIEEVKLCKD